MHTLFEKIEIEKVVGHALIIIKVYLNDKYYRERDRQTVPTYKVVNI